MTTKWKWPFDGLGHLVCNSWREHQKGCRCGLRGKQEVILSENSVVFVTYGGGIFLNVGPGDHTVMRKQITPEKAIDMAQMLLEAATAELRRLKALSS